MSSPLKIYLANLTHIRDGVASTESIPLNIGYLAGYMMKQFGNQGTVKIFNEPDELEKAMRTASPDVFCASSYIWNFYLNYEFISHFKQQVPEMITIMGGPNYPGTAAKQEIFLSEFKDIDFYIFLEGELALGNLISAIFKYDKNIEAVKKEALRGVHCMLGKKFVNGGVEDRIKNLEEVPSPYLIGLFDEMLEKGYTPVLQTNRGCPFTCTYCHSGNRPNHKLFRFNLERVKEEIDYIAQRSVSRNLYIADDNYGIFKHDVEITGKLVEAKKKYAWPMKMIISTSKVNKEQVYEAIKDLGNTLFFSASVQSVNKKTLRQIRRTDLAFEEYKEVLRKLSAHNIESSVELILGLPYETAASHMEAMKISIDAGLTRIDTYTCMLLPNTPLAEDPEHDKFNMQVKWRALPRDFGIYLGKKIIEIEKVCPATSTLALDEYFNLRGTFFVVYCYYNMGVFNEIISYLRRKKLDIFDYLLLIQERLSASNTTAAGKIYSDFLKETREELWDTREELLNHYGQDKNFSRLLSGEAGANLIQKYSALFFDNLSDFFDIAVEVLSEKYDVDIDFIRSLAKFLTAVRGNLFDPDRQQIEEEFNFNIAEWIGDGMNGSTENYRRKLSYRFSMKPEQIKFLEQLYRTFGANADARGKILTRISPEQLYRQVE